VVRICYPIETFEYGMREFAIYDNNGYLLQFGEAVVTRLQRPRCTQTSVRSPGSVTLEQVCATATSSASLIVGLSRVA